MARQVDDRSRGEWLKFGILATVLLGTVLVMWLITPIIFGTIVPAILGDFFTPSQTVTQPAYPAPDQDVNNDTQTQPPDAPAIDQPPPEENGETTVPNVEDDTPPPAYPPPVSIEQPSANPPPVDSTPIDPPPPDVTTPENENAGNPPPTLSTDENKPDDTATTTHVVQAGHTMSAIAGRYGVTVQQIMELNGISDPNRIYPGQVLTIPSQ